MIDGSFGKGAKIVTIDEDTDVAALLESYRTDKVLLEEIITQHEELGAFCPNVLNTIRVNTFVNTRGAARILTAGGRFGRVNKVVDNFHGGGVTVKLDPNTGVIISDAINKAHERFNKHPDTGKVFKGFQYPCWDKVRAVVLQLAKELAPSLRHVGWDIAITDKNTIEVVEGNANPDTDVQQIADGVGLMDMYQPLIDKMAQEDKDYMKFIGYRINIVDDPKNLYQSMPLRSSERVQFALDHLVENCRSLLDIGCRKDKLVKQYCPPNVKYCAVDFEKYDSETIECDFNAGFFPDMKVDTCLALFTAEYVEMLKEFLGHVCHVARRQVLMLCCPIERDMVSQNRWGNPFVTDFTERFLIDSIEQKKFLFVSMEVGAGQSRDRSLRFSEKIIFIDRSVETKRSVIF